MDLSGFQQSFEEFNEVSRTLVKSRGFQRSLKDYSEVLEDFNETLRASVKSQVFQRSPETESFQQSFCGAPEYSQEESPPM